MAILSLAGGASAIVVIGLVLALLRPAPDAPPTTTVPPAPTPRPTQTTIALDIADELALGPHEVDAMSVSPGVVWLGTQGVTQGAAGTLLRVDAASVRTTASWAVGGDPVAVAAAGAFVWVANGPGAGSSPLPGQNTVEQFDAASGALVHTYGVADPRGLAANPTSALVMSANADQQTAIHLLTSGNEQLVTTVPGTLNAPVSSLSPEVAVTSCSGQVFLALTNLYASSSTVTIYSLQQTGGPVHQVVTILDDYEATMTCDSTSLFLIGAAGDGDVSVARVTIADGSVKNLWEGPYPVAVAVRSGRVWIAYADDSLNESVLTSLDPVTGIAATNRSVLPVPANSTDPSLLIPGDTGLWFAASQGNLLLHIATR
jgi:hypothetical protein